MPFSLINEEVNVNNEEMFLGGHVVHDDAWAPLGGDKWMLCKQKQKSQLG